VDQKELSINTIYGKNVITLKNPVILKGDFKDHISQVGNS